uniref:Uncharacterized protein n=1 Tax=Knipowitschia caucasica TaxID=637954 RepID=A0AAV2MCN9_KNICA
MVPAYVCVILHAIITPIIFFIIKYKRHVLIPGAKQVQGGAVFPVLLGERKRKCGHLLGASYKRFLLFCGRGRGTETRREHNLLLLGRCVTD